MINQPGDRVWLRTTAGEMLARLIDPDDNSGIVVWLLEIEGGPQIIGWQKADGGFTALGCLIKQDDSGLDLTAFWSRSTPSRRRRVWTSSLTWTTRLGRNWSRRSSRRCGATNDRRRG